MRNSYKFLADKPEGKAPILKNWTQMGQYRENENRMGGRKLGLSRKDNIQRRGFSFFESVVETQVPLKTWHRLGTKEILKELNSIVLTKQHTHTPKSTFVTTKSTVTVRNGWTHRKPAREDQEKKNKNLPSYLELSFCVGNTKILTNYVTKTDWMGTWNCVQDTFPLSLLSQ